MFHLWHRTALPIMLLAGLALGPAAAQAAGIDCSKARSPAEKSICANAGLLALDQQIAAAYADALARQPDRRDAMRQDLVQWLKQRDAACALPSADMPACLAHQMDARLAALAPPGPAPASPASPTPASPAAAPPPAPLQSPTPVQRPADPAIPPGTLPLGAASLDQASLPATAAGQTLLRVTSPGRFTITAKSAAGAALQLVDIMAGPGPVAGAPGAQDGRVDALLDAGTYKLKTDPGAGASGTVALSVMAFHDAAPPAALPQPGFPAALSLRDGEQRAYWLTVPPDGAVRIEAAGRSLADLRLWRDGRDLAALEPAAMRAEPAPGRPLTDLRLVGTVEPGTYLAVAYGGAPLAWTDGDAAQPFLLRAGASPTLAEGWAGGPMGPFGSEVYALPPAAGLLKLTLPAPASATLLAGDAQADIARTDREPKARLAVDAKQAGVAEIRAQAGQAFVLQALEQPAGRTVNRPGTYWVSAVVNGAGGDELPPGVLLDRVESPDKPPRILASTVPQIGPAAAWRARFNLRGPTTLLLQNTAGGVLAVRNTGAPVTQRGRPGIYSLPADYYGLDVAPERGAQGSVDLTVGPPGAAVPPLVAWPADPVVPLGIQAVAPGQVLRLFGPSGPGVSVGLSARKVPVALAEGPLTVTQAAGAGLSVPVILAPGGTLAVSEVGGGPVAYGLQAASPGSTVVVPIADHARSVVLAWRRTAVPAPIAAPPPPGATAAFAPGSPAAFDLAQDETRGFILTVADGGLYQVATTGRLRTAGRIATAFIPRLAEAEANGPGQNMLLQEILRAGRYRVEVTAHDSAGHLGLAVAPAPILDGAALGPGGSVRTRVPAGAALRLKLLATAPGGRYRLEAATLGAPWLGRIEDAEGWPVTGFGPLDGTTPTLPAGAYRLVVAAPAVDRQIALRLSAIVPPQEITGHGPHPLPFDAPQSATWREPAGADQPRLPDVWAFALAGPAKVRLTLGDGMVGSLRPAGGGAPIGRVTGSFEAALEAGSYWLEASSLGRNDRLAYTLALASDTLQPGVPRKMTVPGTAWFAIAQARVVSVTTFGNVPVKASLWREDGSLVARLGARGEDWNLALSRPLPAGRYRLDMAAAAPPRLASTAQAAPGSTDADPDAGKPDDDEQDMQSTPAAAPAGDDAAQASPDDTASEPATEILLSLPDILPEAPAPADATALAGAGVHALRLPPVTAGQLIVAQAASRAPVVLALERADGDGWRVVGLDDGVSPIVASPADAASAPWRVEAWALDGGSEPITAAIRAVDLPAQAASSVSLAALAGMPAPVAAARVQLASAVPAEIGAMPGLRAGGWAGQALAAPDGPVLPEADSLWLLARDAGAVSVGPLALDGAQALVVPPGQAAELPNVPAAYWRAEGAFAQPGLDAAAGIAAFSAIAPASPAVTLRNASGTGPLRVTLSRIAPAPLPPQRLDAAWQMALPPRAALTLQMPPGDKTLQLALGGGVAAFVHGAAAWGGGAPTVRTFTGDWAELTLVNTGDDPAPASVTLQPGPAKLTLQPGTVIKRFFGAAGAFELPFDAPPGARATVAGDATLTAIAADGTVARGREAAVTGAGRIVVQHGAGPVALWLDAPGTSAWPEVQAQPLAAPARLELAGPAMAFALDLPAASLLHVSTTAPVLAALSQAGRADAPRLYPAGADFQAVAAAGPARLLLYSPTDGPLTGSLVLSAAPITPIGEGLSEAVTVAPGGTAAFAFTLAKAATIGVGVRAEPDRVSVRLLDSSGGVLGVGVAQLRTLPAGPYVIEAQVPPDGAPTLLRPAVVGITPRGAGPPPDVVRSYLELAGLKPQRSTP